MKDTTREELLFFLQTNSLSETYTIHDLFYHWFAERECSNYDELLNAIDEYCDFLLNHINYIKFNPETIMVSRIPIMIESARQHIKNNFLPSDLQDQKFFTENVSTILGTSEIGHLLDVGPGGSAVSSLLFANKCKKVSAMDSHFYLSQQALKHMNVVAYNNYFSKNTSVSDYDIIVGRAPCSAIEPMVANCSAANKPYIILLCDCHLPRDKKLETPSLGWEQVLPLIDPKIRFHGQYAFNIDATPEQVSKIIKDYTYKPLKQRLLVEPSFEFDYDFDI